MLADLIKLSKELYELEMIEESLSVDSMIQKLYGMPHSSTDYTSVAQDEGEDKYLYKNSVESLKEEIMLKASDHMFKDDLAGIIYEAFSANDIEEIRDLLTEYIE